MPKDHQEGTGWQDWRMEEGRRSGKKRGVRQGAAEAEVIVTPAEARGVIRWVSVEDFAEAQAGEEA